MMQKKVAEAGELIFFLPRGGGGDWKELSRSYPIPRTCIHCCQIKIGSKPMQY